MNKRIILGAVVFAVVVSGCAIKPNPEEIGPYPSNYKEMLKAHVLRTYFDPYSLRSVSVSQPIQGHLFFQQGWVVCLESNAKNRMGGYAGLQRTAYLLNRNAVVQTMEKATLCDDARVSYSPWPELEQMK
jgi:hypothetical protein